MYALACPGLLALVPPSGCFAFAAADTAPKATDVAFASTWIVIEIGQREESDRISLGDLLFSRD